MDFYGGGYYARFEPLTKWYPVLIEEIMRDLKDYISKINPQDITEISQ